MSIFDADPLILEVGYDQGVRRTMPRLEVFIIFYKKR